MPERPKRRSQADRTAATRAALLDATLECLVEVGFSGTTTTEVARRAGVSLGALVHHFPAKSDLLAAAVQHVLERRQADFRKAMADADMGADRLSTAIDLLWKQYDSPTFTAWLELWVAARTDAELRAAALDVAASFQASSDEVFRELFPPSEYPGASFLEFGRAFAMTVMDGAALFRTVTGDEAGAGVMVEILKRMSAQVVPHADPGGEP